MKVSKQYWWYKIPSQFNKTLRYYNPSDLCSLMRSLVWGWGVAMCVYFLFAAIAICLFTVPLVAYRGHLPEEGLITPLFIFGCALWGGAFTFIVLYSWFEWVRPGISNLWDKLFPTEYLTPEESYQRYVDARREAEEKQLRREASIIYQWRKGLKEKTCVLIEYK